MAQNRIFRHKIKKTHYLDIISLNYHYNNSIFSDFRYIISYSGCLTAISI